MNTTTSIIILAAGMGKRMKSEKAKVLHEICGRPMINYVLAVATRIVDSQVIVVIGHQAEQVRHIVSQSYDVQFAVQEQQMGTGHAVSCAVSAIADTAENVVVLCGDVPLIRLATLEEMIADHQTHRRDVSVLAVAVPDPTGYGRVIVGANGQLTGIVEESDADEDQKKINLVNSGMYVIKKSFLVAGLPQLNSNNAQKEIYLTGIIALGCNQKRNIGAIVGRDPDEIIGVNSKIELDTAEKLMKIRGC
jgi:bifunctional UDP-N-acetylglucosamine pyrophosphorylase/glucosamine-1-phosphate N-acetyltransferase/UDP-N-acetylglucosamine pyrophosphorylase